MISKLFKRRASEYVVYTVIVAAVIILGMYIFWTVEDPRMLEIKNAKSSESIQDGTIFTGIPIRPSTVNPGGVVFMHLDYCKLHTVDGSVTARLVGQKFTTDLTWPEDQTKEGCVNIEIPIPLPEKANDDTYYVQFEVHYQVNPVKDRHVILRSDSFKVSK